MTEPKIHRTKNDIFINYSIMDPGVKRIIKDTVNTYVVPQEHKARTLIMHLQFGGNVSEGFDLFQKMTLILRNSAIFFYLFVNNYK